MRRLVRTGLELEGFRVLEAGSPGQVRGLLAESVDAVVLDNRLDGGDGLHLLAELTERWPHVRMVLHPTIDWPDDVGGDGDGGAGGLVSVPKGDVIGIVAALGLTVHETSSPGPHPLLTPAQADRLRERWGELCRWDPALPPDAEPALAESMVRALGAAFQRPQPLGWGLDPALESTAEAFAVNAGSVDAALAQLVCLHEAFVRTVLDDVAPGERDEYRGRLDMIIHRTMVVAGQVTVRRLAEEALTDPLTGIHNRRAFDLDLEREVARARRHHRSLTLAVIDVDGLKEINDGRGHKAGDDALRAVAEALDSTARLEDGAYRIGGDEFALILVDTDVPDEEILVDRLRAGGAPACSVGLATLAEDAAPDDLVRRADSRLYERRGRR